MAVSVDSTSTVVIAFSSCLLSTSIYLIANYNMNIVDCIMLFDYATIDGMTIKYENTAVATKIITFCMCSLKSYVYISMQCVFTMWVISMGRCGFLQLGHRYYKI